MRPSTSSITAPAMMDTPSSESIFLRSDRIRAVMPTLVAVDMMPMYIGAASIMACARGISERYLNLSKNSGSRYTAQRLPSTKEPTTPPIPTMSPTKEYLRKRRRFVSRPERKRRMMEASVAKPYSSGVVAAYMTPSFAESARREAPWKRPPENIPSPKPIPPSAQGPITIPAASSPRMDGILKNEATMPPSLAANMITPI